MNNTYYDDYFNNACFYDVCPNKDCELYDSQYKDRQRTSENQFLSSHGEVLENNYSSFDDNRVDSFFNQNEGFAKGNMQANIYKPYKLTNPVLPQVYNERQRMLLEVQKYGFAMWDLNLYLNTHPMDRNVMMLFDQYRNAHKKAKEDYESKYGPLCLEHTPANSGYWLWNKSPWPWEGE